MTRITNEYIGTQLPIDADTLNVLDASDFAHVQHQSTNVDLNTITTSGMHRLEGSPVNGPPICAYCQMLVVHGGGDTINQTVYAYSNGNVYTRSGNPSDVGGVGSWTNWAQVWTSESDGAGSGLDADKLDALDSTQFLRSDADDTATGDLTFNGTLDVTGEVTGPTFNGDLIGSQHNLKFIGALSVPANNSNWWRVCTLSTSNQPAIVNFVIATASHLQIEVKVSKGAGGDNIMAEAWVRGHYSYWNQYPHNIRVVPAGTNAETHIDIQLDGTYGGTTGFYVSEYSQYARANDSFVTYPFTDVGSASAGNSTDIFDAGSCTRRYAMLLHDKKPFSILPAGIEIEGTVISGWVTKTTNYAAKNGDKILADSSGGGFWIELPASPTPGDTIEFIDAGGTHQTNNLTILRNSKNILGVAEDLNCDIENGRWKMTYYDATEGWKVNY